MLTAQTHSCSLKNVLAGMLTAQKHIFHQKKAPAHADSAKNRFLQPLNLELKVDVAKSRCQKCDFGIYF